LKNQVVASVAVVLGLCLSAAAQTAPTKLGIINIQAAMIGTKDGQKAAADLQSRSGPRQKELEKKKADIEAMREQLNRTSNTASEDAKRKLMSDIDTRTKAFNRDVEDVQAELEGEQQKIIGELGGKMMQVIEKYARDNAYAVIIDVSSQQTPVVYASSSVDITKDIIELYDKNAASLPAAVPGARPATMAPRPTTPAAPKPAPAPAK
jgi:outer membrane protein